MLELLNGSFLFLSLQLQNEIFTHTIEKKKNISLIRKGFHAVLNSQKNSFKETLSVLMLCTPVFIHVFTSSSSALLGRPCCGLSVWLPPLAIFNTLFWVYAKFSWENWQNKNTQRVSAIFVWYQNGHQWLRIMSLALKVNVSILKLCTHSYSCE